MLFRWTLSTLERCLYKSSACSVCCPNSKRLDKFTSSVCYYGTTPEVKPRTSESANRHKLVVVGGGSGGCAVAAKFSFLGRECAIIEPNDMHYYQPIWTLVGAGLKGFQTSVHPMKEVLPTACEWIKDRAVSFQPDKNIVILQSGQKIHYDYLVLAMGIQLDYNKVKGLVEALEKDPMVCSNYHFKFVNKTFSALQAFQGGNAIFTFPNTPIKCAGAPQKIMYLADEYFRTINVRDKTKVIFNTSLGVIFGVKKYANALLKVIENRKIEVNYKHNLVEVDHSTRTAIFANLDDTNKPVPFKYDFLHVAPPMSCPDVLKKSPLISEAGWVDVHKHTLQHTKYPNVFGLGDCTSLPTSKTAAAVAAQSGILQKNLTAVMEGRQVMPLYDGYTSCPLVTSSKSCILAEFDYDGNPLETFPFNQGKERALAYKMKAYVMPEIYWKAMLTGKWNGPSTVRKVMHLGLDRSPKLSAK